MIDFKAKQAFFVTGTDTGVGKTVITAALLHAFEAYGLKTLGLKPIASGCEDTPFGLRNEDGVLLHHASSVKAPYDTVNPICFKPPIAPHIAAVDNDYDLTVQNVVSACQNAFALKKDLLLVEGAGGWMVPFNEHETYADFAKALNVPVILVVGLRLGCLSHALLTVKAIESAGLTLAGWIGNEIVPSMNRSSENIETLLTMIKAPLLGTIPYMDDINPKEIASRLCVESFVNKMQETESNPS